MRRDVRQYQYYPSYNQYNYNQQYGNGYGNYPQNGNFPQYAYDQNNYQTGNYGQVQQVVNDVCDDRAANFQDKGLFDTLLHIFQPQNARPQGTTLPGMRPGTTNPNPGMPPGMQPAMQPQQAQLPSFFNLIKILIKDFFGDKSFGEGIINKSTGRTATCNEVKSFVESEYQKFQQNPQSYASQIQGQNNGQYAPVNGPGYGPYVGQNSWNNGQYGYSRGYGPYGVQNQLWGR